MAKDERKYFWLTCAVIGWSLGGSALGFAIGFFGTYYVSIYRLTSAELSMALWLGPMMLFLGIFGCVFGFFIATVIALRLIGSRYSFLLSSIGYPGYIVSVGIVIATIWGWGL